MERVTTSLRHHIQGVKVATLLLSAVVLCFVLSVWTARYPAVGNIRSFAKVVIREKTEILETTVIREKTEKREKPEDLPEGNSCDRILTSARLPETQNPWFIVNGCKLHKYSHRDAQTCMYKIAKLKGFVHIAMNGDSRMRNLFASLTKFLGKVDWQIPVPLKHTPVFEYYNSDLATKVTFFFHAYMNSGILADYSTWQNTTARSRPDVIIQGNAMWDLTFGGPFEVSSRNFRGNLSRVVPLMKNVSKATDILWMIQDPPDIRKLTWVDTELRGPHKIDAFNKMAVELLSPTPVKLWRTARTVALRFPDLSDPGGIHYLPPVIDYKVQLFLNWFCNRHMHFPDGTCCSSQEET